MLNWIELIINSNSIHELIWALPTSFCAIKVNFDRIQFEDYYIYQPNSFCDEDTYCLLQNSAQVFRYSS